MTLTQPVARRMTTFVSTNDATTFGNSLQDDYTIDLTGDITVPAAGSTSSAFTITGVTNLKINGNGYSIKFSSSDSGNGRFFYIDSASEVEMNDVTLENGYVYSSSSIVYGGAIYLTGSSTLTMTSCILTGNTAYVRFNDCVQFYWILPHNRLNFSSK